MCEQGRVRFCVVQLGSWGATQVPTPAGWKRGNAHRCCGVNTTFVLAGACTWSVIGCGVVDKPVVARGAGGYPSPLCGSGSGAGQTAPKRRVHRGLTPCAIKCFRAVSHFLTFLSITYRVGSYEQSCHQTLPRHMLSPQPEGWCLRHRRGRGMQGAGLLSPPEMPELAPRWGWECVGERVGLQHPKYRWEVPSYPAVGLHSRLWQ